MDIPIDNQYPVCSGPLRLSCGDNHIIDEAESHPFAGEGVMPGRPNGSKSMALSSDGVLHSRKRRTGSPECCGPAVGAQYGIEKKRTTASRADRLDRPEIRLWMNRQQRLHLRKRCFLQRDTGLTGQPVEHCAQPVCRLRMIAAWIVLQAGWMGEHRESH